MRNYIELTKPRITILILICAAVGFAFGTAGPTRIATLVHTLLGTALMASGTAALNQWYEAAGDSKMRRTRMRPIPARRIPRERALCFGLFLSVAGFVDLWLGTNRLAALLGLFTLVSYLLIYTPMKQRSPVCTTLGAIPGAMPPLIGFAAASGTSTREAWALFLILFAWQFPHFYSIAWLYREDYARAGIRMLHPICRAIFATGGAPPTHARDGWRRLCYGSFSRHVGLAARRSAFRPAKDCRSRQANPPRDCPVPADSVASSVGRSARNNIRRAGSSGRRIARRLFVPRFRQLPKPQTPRRHPRVLIALQLQHFPHHELRYGNCVKTGMQTMPESELITAGQQGDRAAISELFGRHYSYCLHVARGFCARKTMPKMRFNPRYCPLSDMLPIFAATPASELGSLEL
jgi:protoheme IX farnesyltransferase